MHIRVGVWGCALVVAAVMANLAGCSGGGGGGSKKPTIDTITPATANLSGGETIAIAGNRFGDAATVTVGGGACTNVVVVDDDNLTCTVPAGTAPGLVTVEVTTDDGSDDVDDEFGYASAIVSIYPAKIATGIPLEIRGDFFSAGTVTVSVGGAPCTSVTVVNDETVRCVTGTITGAPPTSAAVRVTNDHGTSSFGGPIGGVLFAADGRGGAVGNLYLINELTAQTTTAAALAMGLTGLTFTDDGRLLGAEATQYGSTASLVVGTSQLVSIDLFTGAHTIMGSLLGTDGNVNHASIPDIFWEAGTLFGWTEASDDPITIEEDGTVHGLGSGDHPTTGSSGFSYGSGMSVDDDGTVWFVGGGVANPTSGTDNRLYLVNLATGTLTTGASLAFTGIATSYDRINALAFMDGTLYGVASPTNGDPEPPLLISINTSSGGITVIGPLPMDIDTLASTRR